MEQISCGVLNLVFDEPELTNAFRQKCVVAHDRDLETVSCRDTGSDETESLAVADVCKNVPGIEAYFCYGAAPGVCISNATRDGFGYFGYGM